jgi:hypothetical protein
MAGDQRAVRLCAAGSVSHGVSRRRTVPAAPDLWAAFSEIAGHAPKATAVRESSARAFSYGDLHQAAADQAAWLARLGVRSGDHVAIAARRGFGEVVAVLAVLRCGATCVGLPPSVPPALAGAMLDQVKARVVLGQPGRLAALGPAVAQRATLVISPDADAGRVRPGASDTGSAALVDPAVAVHAQFRIGPGGVPRPAWVSRAQLALAGSAVSPSGSLRRFVRLTPLALSQSMAEILFPLLAGGTVEIFPGLPLTPASLASFTADRHPTGLMLDAAACRRIADYRPAAFSSVEQLVVTGGRLPAAQADRIHQACPKLQLSYPEPGDGWLAAASQDIEVDTAAIADVLREHPEVSDAVIVPLPGRRMLAAVIAADEASLVAELREYTAERLPAGAVPDEWVIAAEFPRSSTGEPDAAMLAASSGTRPPRLSRASAPGEAELEPRGARSPAGRLEDLVQQAWRKALGNADFDNDTDFFAAGGTSMGMLRLRDALRDLLPGRVILMRDLYRHPTVRSFAGRLTEGVTSRSEQS